MYKNIEFFKINYGANELEPSCMVISILAADVAFFLV